MNNLPTISNYGHYASDNYGVNSLRIEIGVVTVWFSYKTPVAFQVGSERVVRQNQWGPTTGKHLNWIDDGDHKSRVTSEEFQRRYDEMLATNGLQGFNHRSLAVVGGS